MSHVVTGTIYLLNKIVPTCAAKKGEQSEDKVQCLKDHLTEAEAKVEELERDNKRKDHEINNLEGVRFTSNLAYHLAT